MKRLIKADTFTLCFYECSHSGDLKQYENDVRKCLGNNDSIVNQRIDTDSEEGYIRVNFESNDSKQEFITKFKQTPSCGFSNIM